MCCDDTDLPAFSGAFERWAGVRRSDPMLSDDYATASRSLELNKLTPTKQQDAKSEGRPKRGRPPVKTENPIARLAPFIVLDRPGWFQDIVYGSISRAAGTSKGRLNVRLSDVVSLLYMSEISTVATSWKGLPARSSQAITQSARHVIDGVVHYLSRNPHVKAHFDSCADIEDEFVFTVVSSV